MLCVAAVTGQPPIGARIDVATSTVISRCRVMYRVDPSAQLGVAVFCGRLLDEGRIEVAAKRMLYKVDIEAIATWRVG